MTRNRDISPAMQAVLDHHPELILDGIDGSGVPVVVLKKVRTNLIGNFPGGEMAYLANAAAGLVCISKNRLAETVNLNLDCLARADGDLLVARTTIIKAGRRLIRLRIDIHVRATSEEKLVAIAQVTMMPIDDMSMDRLINER